MEDERSLGRSGTGLDYQETMKRIDTLAVHTGELGNITCLASEFNKTSILESLVR